MSELRAVALVLREPRYRLLSALVFVAAFALYAITLPAAYTGGIIGPTALRYLDGPLLFFSVALAALLAVAIALNVHAFRTSLRRRGTGLSVGAVLASLVPGSVCCTSLVPSVLAVFGASTPQIFGLTGRIQGFVATYEVAFLAAALAILLVSVWFAARNVTKSCPVPRGSLDRHDASHQNLPS